MAGEAGCVKNVTAPDPEGCAHSRALGPDLSAAVASPDGSNVYFANSELGSGSGGENGAITTFERKPGGQLLFKDCISGDATDGQDGTCVDGQALGAAKGLAVSPDGKNVYVAAAGANAVTTLKRATDGTLTPVQCISQDGKDGEGGTGTCVDGYGLEGANSVAVSPDGKNVYVSAGSLSAISVFKRAEDGTLTEQQCFSDTGADGDPDGTACNNAYAPIFETTDVAVSHDGKNVYLAVSEAIGLVDGIHGPGAVAVFKRAEDGTLSEFGGDDLLKNCNSRLQSCRLGRGLGDALSIFVSQDDKNVYVASQGASEILGTGAVSYFTREADGALTMLGCMSKDGLDGDGTEGECATARSFKEPSDIVVTSDGKYAYASAEDDATIAAFSRAATGNLTQLAGTDGCITQTSPPAADGTCAQGRSLKEASRFALVDNCNTLYVTAADSSGVSVLSRQTDCIPISSANVPACSTSGNITVSVNDTAGDVGTKKLHYRLDAGTEQTVATGSGNPGTVVLAVPEGRHTLLFWGEDQRGLVEATQHTTSVIVDRTKPSVTIVSDQGKNVYQQGEVASITVTASDENSGLAVNPSASGQRIDTSSAGPKTVQKTAVDKCGNSQIATFSYTVNAAPPPPPPPPPPAPPPARCVVPKVTGMTLRQARAAINRRRCRVGSTRRARSVAVAGRVIGQRPRAGTRLAVGSRVNLVLSAGVPFKKPPFTG